MQIVTNVTIVNWNSCPFWILLCKYGLLGDTQFGFPVAWRSRKKNWIENSCKVTYLKNKAVVSTSLWWEWKFLYFDNLLTMIKILLTPLDKGSSGIKSIDTTLNGWEGMGIGCNKSSRAWCLGLAFWHISQVDTYHLISLGIVLECFSGGCVSVVNNVPLHCSPKGWWIVLQKYMGACKTWFLNCHQLW